MGVRPMVNWNYRILGPPPPLPAHLSHFGKNFYRPQTLPYGSWTYQKPVCGPMQKPACGPIGDRFVDLLETGLWTYRKPVCGPMRKQVRGPMQKPVRGPMRKPVRGLNSTSRPSASLPGGLTKFLKDTC